MTTKVCSKCKVDQCVQEFCVDRKRKDGRYPQCKTCRRTAYQVDRAAILEDRKAYYQANQERVKQTVSVYRKNNRDVISLKAKEYSKRNIERRKAYYKEYRAKNLERVRERERIYARENKDARYKKSLPYQKEWSRKRRKSDPLFAIKDRVRVKINQSLRSVKKRKSQGTQKYLGCTWRELAIHIERQFTPNMNWDNRDKWHIDHIVPVSSAKTIDELMPLLHFTNLRPLLVKDNLEKSDKRLLLI